MAEREFPFGFLSSPSAISFGGGRIEPVSDYEQRWAAVRQLVNPEDGFSYPPVVRKVRHPVDRPDLQQEIVGTRRAQFLWSLPASHVLRVQQRKGRDVEREDAWFLVNLTGYLFGVRLKPEHWRFDGRVPVELQRTHNIHFSAATASEFLTRSYSTWRGWPKHDRTLFATLLHSHCRGPSYEWDWERFGAEYAVFDALWRVAVRSKLVPKTRAPHAKRLSILAKSMRVRHPRAIVARIVKLRNALVHEGLWDGGLPGNGTVRGFRLADDIRRLNQRLIPAVLGYRNEYVRTSWSAMGTFAFDPVGKQ